jgi:hypothetical protein
MFITMYSFAVAALIFGIVLGGFLKEGGEKDV